MPTADARVIVDRVLSSRAHEPITDDPINEAAKALLAKFLVALQAENVQKDLERMILQKQIEEQVLALLLAVLCVLRKSEPVVAWESAELAARFEALGLIKPQLHKVLGAVVPVAKAISLRSITSSDSFLSASYNNEQNEYSIEVVGDPKNKDDKATVRLATHSVSSNSRPSLDFIRSQGTQPPEELVNNPSLASRVLKRVFDSRRGPSFVRNFNLLAKDIPNRVIGIVQSDTGVFIAFKEDADQSVAMGVTIPRKEYKKIVHEINESDLKKAASKAIHVESQLAQVKLRLGKIDGYQRTGLKAWFGRNESRTRQIADLKAVTDSKVSFYTVCLTVAKVISEIDAEKNRFQSNLQSELKDIAASICSLAATDIKSFLASGKSTTFIDEFMRGLQSPTSPKDLMLIFGQHFEVVKQSVDVYVNNPQNSDVLRDQFVIDFARKFNIPVAPGGLDVEPEQFFLVRGKSEYGGKSYAEVLAEILTLRSPIAEGNLRFERISEKLDEIADPDVRRNVQMRLMHQAQAIIRERGDLLQRFDIVDKIIQGWPTENTADVFVFLSGQLTEFVEQFDKYIGTEKFDQELAAASTIPTFKVNDERLANTQLIYNDYLAQARVIHCFRKKRGETELLLIDYLRANGDVEEIKRRIGIFRAASLYIVNDYYPVLLEVLSGLERHAKGDLVKGIDAIRSDIFKRRDERREHYVNFKGVLTSKQVTISDVLKIVGDDKFTFAQAAKLLCDYTTSIERAELLTLIDAAATAAASDNTNLTTVLQLLKAHVAGNVQAADKKIIKHYEAFLTTSESLDPAEALVMLNNDQRARAISEGLQKCFSGRWNTTGFIQTVSEYVTNCRASTFNQNADEVLVVIRGNIDVALRGEETAFSFAPIIRAFGSEEQQLELDRMRRAKAASEILTDAAQRLVMLIQSNFDLTQATNAHIDTLTISENLKLLIGLDAFELKAYANPASKKSFENAYQLFLRRFLDVFRQNDLNFGANSEFLFQLIAIVSRFRSLIDSEAMKELQQEYLDAMSNVGVERFRQEILRVVLASKERGVITIDDTNQANIDFGVELILRTSHLGDDDPALAFYPCLLVDEYLRLLEQAVQQGATSGTVDRALESKVEILYLLLQSFADVSGDFELAELPKTQSEREKYVARLKDKYQENLPRFGVIASIYCSIAALESHDASLNRELQDCKMRIADFLRSLRSMEDGFETNIIGQLTALRTELQAVIDRVNTGRVHSNAAQSFLTQAHQKIAELELIRLLSPRFQELPNFCETCLHLCQLFAPYVVLSTDEIRAAFNGDPDCDEILLHLASSLMSKGISVPVDTLDSAVRLLGQYPVKSVFKLLRQLYADLHTTPALFEAVTKRILSDEFDAEEVVEEADSSLWTTMVLREYVSKSINAICSAVDPNKDALLSNFVGIISAAELNGNRDGIAYLVERLRVTCQSKAETPERIEFDICKKCLAKLMCHAMIRILGDDTQWNKDAKPIDLIAANYCGGNIDMVMAIIGQLSTFLSEDEQSKLDNAMLDRFAKLSTSYNSARKAVLTANDTTYSSLRALLQPQLKTEKTATPLLAYDQISPQAWSLITSLRTVQELATVDYRAFNAIRKLTAEFGYSRTIATGAPESFKKDNGKYKGALLSWLANAVAVAAAIGSPSQKLECQTRLKVLYYRLLEEGASSKPLDTHLVAMIKIFIQRFDDADSRQILVNVNDLTSLTSIEAFENKCKELLQAQSPKTVAIGQYGHLDGIIDGAVTRVLSLIEPSDLEKRKILRKQFRLLRHFMLENNIKHLDVVASGGKGITNDLRDAARAIKACTLYKHNQSSLHLSTVLELSVESTRNLRRLENNDVIDVSSFLKEVNGTMHRLQTYFESARDSYSIDFLDFAATMSDVYAYTSEFQKKPLGVSHADISTRLATLKPAALGIEILKLSDTALVAFVTKASKDLQSREYVYLNAIIKNGGAELKANLLKRLASVAIHQTQGVLNEAETDSLVANAEAIKAIDTVRALLDPNATCLEKYGKEGQHHLQDLQSLLGKIQQGSLRLQDEDVQYAIRFAILHLAGGQSYWRIRMCELLMDVLRNKPSSSMRAFILEKFSNDVQNLYAYYLKAVMQPSRKERCWPKAYFISEDDEANKAKHLAYVSEARDALFPANTNVADPTPRQKNIAILAQNLIDKKASTPGIKERTYIDDVLDELLRVGPVCKLCVQMERSRRISASPSGTPEHPRKASVPIEIRGLPTPERPLEVDSVLPNRKDNLADREVSRVSGPTHH